MKKIFCNIVVVIMAFVGICVPSKAHDSYLIHHFNPQGETPQSQVSTILQDAKGYIWLGGQDGLYRYDANECRKIEIPVHNPGYLIINDLCEAPGNDIWIASATGLLRFDSRINKVVRYQSDESDPSVPVTKVIRFDDKSILISAREQGAFLISEDTYECTKIQIGENAEDYYSSSLCRTEDGDVYILVRGRGIYRLSPSDKAMAKPLTLQKIIPLYSFPQSTILNISTGALLPVLLMRPLYMISKRILPRSRTGLTSMMR